MIDLNQVLTFSEAAEKWGFANGNTLRKAVERKRFTEDEIRKSGDVWLTTYEAMIRVFGQPRKLDLVISMERISDMISNSLLLREDVEKEVEEMFSLIQQIVEQGQCVTVVDSQNHPNHIFSVLRSTEDLGAFTKQMKRYLNSLSIGT